MTDDNGNSNTSPLDALRRYVPLAVWAAVILVILAIPLKIISYGYLPPDDALRHAAKAVSGKPWPEILVVGPGFRVDHNFGWHFLLRQIYLGSKSDPKNETRDTEKLVVFSVVALFTLAGWSVLPWLKRPEAWLITLTIFMVSSGIMPRLMIGRPLLLTIAGLLTLLFAWQAQGTSPPKWWTAAWMAALIAACTFVHGVWYLWALPVAAFFLAGQFRWGWMLVVGWAAGTFLGASLTGHPFESPYQAVVIAFQAFGLHAAQRTQVTELQPFAGDVLAVVVFGGLLVLRCLGGFNIRPWKSNPAFWLVCICWVLGFKTARFWNDWGLPALMVLTACDLQLLLEARFAADSLKRLALAGGLAVMTCLAATNDSGSRWTYNLTQQYLTPDNPDLNGWLPEKGGIFYTVDMALFFQTFFKNPQAGWRYIVGYEPALMPDEDLQVYNNILWNFCDAKAFDPWVKKMRPEDRLVVHGSRGSPPNIPQLEWEYGVSDIWIGRLPRIPQSGTPPPTFPATAPR